MRVLGVDFGGKRIGLAIGETDHRVATPRPNLAATGALRRDAEAIHRLAQSENCEAIVVGIPVNEQDERMARVCGQLADHLRALGWAVFSVDESLTSVAAEQDLRQSDLRAAGRRKRVDGVAAAHILERYFDAQSS